MSAETAVTMQDFELEHAELLPGRETLCVSRWHPSCGSGSGFGFSQVGYGEGCPMGRGGPPAFPRVSGTPEQQGADP